MFYYNSEQYDDAIEIVFYFIVKYYDVYILKYMCIGIIEIILSRLQPLSSLVFHFVPLSNV